MTTDPIRVRFAPSPTGHLHIGGVRTALFNWFYARKHRGTFSLRIEDTDRTRSEKQFEDEIQRSLQWLGVRWDGEVVYQSARLHKYQKLAASLVERGIARHVDDTAAIEFCIDPDEEFRFSDMVHGEIVFKGSDVGNIIIMKSDGYPTYNFACVVDDYSQGITHVIRGDDHVSNTPKQIALAQALGYSLPQYAHMPLIMGPDNTPLSKRHGAVALTWYIDEGFSREGLINYLTLLGWGAPGGEEFFTVSQLIEQFSLERVSKTSAIFDEQKLRAINQRHLKAMSDAQYLMRVKEYCSSHNITTGSVDGEQRDRLFILYKERAQTFKDLIEMVRYCWNGVTFEKASIARYLSDPATKEYLTDVHAALAAADTAFATPGSIEETVRASAARQQIKAAALIHPIRVALTGGSVSPGIFELMHGIGKDECLTRIRHVIDAWEAIQEYGNT